MVSFQDQAARDKALQTMASMSSAQIVSASVLHNKAVSSGGPVPFSANENQPYGVRIESINLCTGWSQCFL